MGKILIDEATVKLALEALEYVDAPLNDETVDLWEQKTDAAITALQEALASEAKEQPPLCAPAADGVCESLDCPKHKPAQQEPVAIAAVDGIGQIQIGWIKKPQHNDKLYTSPQPAVAEQHKQEHCQCDECKVVLHSSDCAVHSEPAYPKCECNCGAHKDSERRFMSNTQHTPGPWTVEKIKSDTGNFEYLVPAAKEDGEVVSLLTVVEHNNAIFAVVCDDDNARLIAAAPDLLALAEKIAHGNFTPVDWVQEARAAIAKATGGKV